MSVNSVWYRYSLDTDASGSICTRGQREWSRRIHCAALVQWLWELGGCCYRALSTPYSGVTRLGKLWPSSVRQRCFRRRLWSEKSETAILVGSQTLKPAFHAIPGPRPVEWMYVTAFPLRNKKNLQKITLLYAELKILNLTSFTKVTAVWGIHKSSFVLKMINCTVFKILIIARNIKLWNLCFDLDLNSF